MYRPPPSIGSKSCLWVVGWMYQVDVYLRVRRAVMVDGMSIREAARTFGLHRDTVRKILVLGQIRIDWDRGDGVCVWRLGR